MFSKLGEKCTDLMIQNKIIAQADRELYEYAFEILISQCANIILCFVLGSIFRSTFPTLLYLMFFVPLRVYAGGYHAPNYLLCYLGSFLIIIFFLVIGNMAQLSLTLILLPLILSDILIWFVSPIEDANKPLTESEVKSFKLKIRIIELVELAIIFISFICNIEIKFLFYMAASHYTVAFLLLVSIIANYKNNA